MAPTEEGRGGGLRAALASGLTGAALAAALLAAGCLVLVLVPPGVLVPVGSSRMALGLFHVALVAALAAVAGIVLGLVLGALRVRRPLPTAVALAVTGAIALPVALVANVRHLPGLRDPRSVAGNLALALAAALLALALARLLRERIPDSTRGVLAPTSVLLALVLPGGILALRHDPQVAARALPPSPWSAIPEAGARETLVLVTIDALRADRLGCYGYPRPTSPVIDALAAAGTLYESCIAQAPNTHPSVAAIVTGTALTSFDHVVVRSFLRDGSDTLAHEMRRRGYGTAAVVSNPHLSRKMGFAQGFDVFDDETAMVAAGDAVTAAALAAAARVPGPLFLWVHYLDPHHPYLPPEAHRTEFGPALARIDAMQGLPDLSEQLIAAGKGELLLSEEEWARLGSLYDGEVRNADRALGRLLDGLRAQGRLADARVVVTADHGEEFRDHGGVLHAHSLYRELVRLPLVVWDSRDAAGGGAARGVRDPRLVAATSAGSLLLGAVPDPAALVLSEKLQETPGIAPPLVSLRSAECTLVVPSYRPDPFVLTASRVRESLVSLALFAPNAFRRELHCADDPGETRDVAGERPDQVRALETALGELYRARGMRAGESDMSLPDARTLEQLQGLGYFR